MDLGLSDFHFILSTVSSFIVTVYDNIHVDNKKNIIMDAYMYTPNGALLKLLNIVKNDNNTNNKIIIVDDVA
jgi:hypothetical protein